MEPGMEYVLINRHFADLNPLIVGGEDCEPGHSFGPAVREYTLIHFVSAGCGTYCKGGKEYRIGAGEAFIILPDEVTVYRADETDPWSYHWIGFDGTLSGRFSELPPVLQYRNNWAMELMDCYDTDGMWEYRSAALLFRMYADFFASGKGHNHYVRKVTDYINALYMKELHVEEIAGMMNLDRRYLSRLFRTKTGQTMQDYLIGVRMEAAKKQLEKGKTVAEAAKLCGYEDPCNFSKVFKKRFGISPGGWKQNRK